MKIVSYNIQYGKGLDGRTDLDRIAREVEGADVIALQEVERFFSRSGNVDQVAWFADRFDSYHHCSGAGVDIGIDEVGADGRITHRRRTFGNMVLSRFPIVTQRNHLLPKFGSHGPAMSLQRSALEALIEFPRQRLRVYSTHLSHVTSQERVAQIDRILALHRDAVSEGFAVNGVLDGIDLAQDIPEQNVPRNAVMLGDFNMEPDSDEYARIAGPVSPYYGRITNPDGMIDAWTAATGSEAGGETSDVDDRPARLDYAFVSAALASAIQSCRVDVTATGSDHKPLWLELDV